jgi:hypothetical protein
MPLPSFLAVQLYSWYLLLCNYVVLSNFVPSYSLIRAFSCFSKAWIYEYLPLTQPQQKNQNTLLPRACRWNFGGATRGQRKKVMEWRKDFEHLQLSDVGPDHLFYKFIHTFELLLSYFILIIFSGQLESLQGHKPSNCSRILRCSR